MGVVYWFGIGGVDGAVLKISVHLVAICGVGGVPVFVHHCRWASHCLLEMWSDRGAVRLWGWRMDVVVGLGRDA